MRILHVNNINQVADMHAEALAPLGYTSQVFHPSMLASLAAAPLRLAAMPIRLWDLRHVVGRMNRRHFDLVQIEWASYGALGLASAVPYVIEAHGLDVKYRLRHAHWRRVYAPFMRKAAAMLCITPDLMKPTQLLRPDAHYLPGPIRTDYFSPPAGSRSDHPWTVFLFSRLEFEKRSDIAAEGIAQFAARHPDVRVRLIDWGEWSAPFQRRYGGRFEFMRRVPPDQIRACIWEANVVVGQFSIGCLTLSELQAMSCAKPVITRFVHPWAYPEPPPLYHATTPDEVDAHLEHLFQHEDAARDTGLHARRWVQQQHDTHVVARKLDFFYRSLIGAPATGGLDQC